jgi:plasmid stabilization system protein ParE
MIARIVHAAERLRQFPQLGRRVPEAPERGFREIFELPYRIVYQVTEEYVEIVTVYHGARLFPPQP